MSSDIKDYDHYQSLFKQSSGSQSLLKTSLTREIFDTIKDRQTTYGGTLSMLINSGVINQDSSVGVYATDPEAYDTFSPLLDNVISLYHGVSPKSTQPPLDFGAPDQFYDLDPHKKYVISTRIRCARSLRGFPFNPLLTRQHYAEIENKVINAVQNSPTLRQGTYRTLASISTEERADLKTNHYLFAEPDRFLKAANGDHFWPEGRGIYYNEDKSIMLWVNEEDQLRIISMQEGANIASVYGCLVETINTLTSQLDFVHSDRYGYLTFCPTNIGNTIRASVLIRLPKLGGKDSVLREVAKSCDIQIRGTHGEHSEVDDYTFEISNKKRFGLTEFDAVKNLHDGLKRLIQMETDLEGEHDSAA